MNNTIIIFRYSHPEVPLFFPCTCHPASRFLVWSFIKFKKFFLPACLFCPACLEILPNSQLWPLMVLPARLLDCRKKIHPAHLYFFQKMSVCLFISVWSSIRDFKLASVYSLFSKFWRESDQATYYNAKTIFAVQAGVQKKK